MFSKESIQESAPLQLAQPMELPLPTGSEGDVFVAMDNLRPEKRGHRNVLSPRLGSSIAQVGGSNFLKASASLIRTYPFNVSLADGVRNIVAVQYTNGISLYDIDEEREIDIGFPGSMGNDPVDFVPVGRFLYVFSTQESAYLPLEGLDDPGVTYIQAHRWMATYAKPVQQAQALAVQHARLDQVETKRVGGIGVGSKVVAFPNMGAAAQETGVTIEYDLDYPYDDNDPNAVRDGFLLEYGKTYRFAINSEVGLVVRGVLYNTNNYIFKATNNAYAYMSHADAINYGVPPSVYEVTTFAGWQLPNYLPFETTVTRITKGSTSLAYRMYVRDVLDAEVEHEVALPTSEYKVLPSTPDTEDLIQRGSRYFKEEQGTVVVTDEYAEPQLYRGYRLVELLDDGSLTVPGATYTTSVSLQDYIQQKGQISSVPIQLPAPETNVVGRYLYATRWLSNQDLIFTPTSSRYPNGPFFFHSSLEAKAYTPFWDEKPDTQLAVPMSSEVDMSAGVVNWMTPSGAASAVRPSTATSFRNSILLGGYALNRPIPLDGKNVEFSHPGSGPYELQIYFKYSDGRYSPPETWAIPDLIEGTVSFRFGSLNAYISSVEVYIVYNAESRIIMEFGQNDFRFHGKPIPIKRSDFTEVGVVRSTPSTDSQQPTIPMGQYVLSLSPPQNVSVVQQNKVDGNSLVRRLYITDMTAGLDATKYRVVAVTNNDVQVGIIESGLDFMRADFSPVLEGDTFTRIQAVRRFGNSLLMTVRRGLVRIGPQGAVEFLLDREQVYVPDSIGRLLDQADGIAYSAERGEFLISTGSPNLVVLSPEYGWRTYSYASNISGICDINKRIYAGQRSGATDFNLRRFEDPSAQEVVTGTLITAPIGDLRSETRLIEATAHGVGLNTRINVDLQSARRHSSVSGWVEEFAHDYQTQILPVTEKGVYFQLQSQAVAPQLKYEFTKTSAGVSPCFIESLGLTIRSFKTNSRRTL